MAVAVAVAVAVAAVAVAVAATDAGVVQEWRTSPQQIQCRTTYRLWR